MELANVNSEAHHFKEHSWGYGKSRSGLLQQYEVNHPEWRSYAKADASLEIDWKRLYGGTWGFLSDKTPDSVFLCEGSPITVSFLN